jgi:hypothetical protein
LQIVNEKDTNTSADISKTEMDKNSEKLIDALDADKLLNKNDFELTVEKGLLTINGISQSNETNEKYRSYTSQFGSSTLKMNVSQN